MDLAVSALSSLEVSSTDGGCQNNEFKTHIVGMIMDSVALALDTESTFAQVTVSRVLPLEVISDAVVVAEDADGVHIWTNFLAAYFQKKDGVRLIYQVLI